MSVRTQRVPGVSAPWSTAAVTLAPPNLRTYVPSASDGGIGSVTGLENRWAWHDQTPAKYHTPAVGHGGQRDVSPDWTPAKDFDAASTLGPREFDREKDSQRQGVAYSPIEPPQLSGMSGMLARRSERLQATYGGGPRLGPRQQFGELSGGFPMGGLPMGPGGPPPPMLGLPAGRPHVPLLPPGGAHRPFPVLRTAAESASARQFSPLLQMLSGDDNE